MKIINAQTLHSKSFLVLWLGGEVPDIISQNRRFSVWASLAGRITPSLVIIGHLVSNLWSAMGGLQPYSAGHELGCYSV